MIAAMPRGTVRALIAVATLSALVTGCAGTRPVLTTELQFVFGHEDRPEHRTPAAVEVVLRDGWGTTLHGVESDGIYYSRGGALYRKPLSDAPAEVVHSIEQPPRLVTSAGKEVIWVSADCEVTSSVQHGLGGECLASPADVFVDGETIYLFAFAPSKWRQPEMTLWTMPRRHAVAKKVATLPDFLQLFGASRPVFDGQYFYYMGLYGQVFRVSKHGGAPKRFLDLPVLEGHEMKLADGEAVYFSARGQLVRAPTNGGPAVAFAQIGNGGFARDATHAYLATERDLYVAPVAGGTWEWVTGLPEGAWQVRAMGGRVYVWDRDEVLRVTLNGPRPKPLLDLDDVLVSALAATRRGLYFTTDENFTFSEHSENQVFLLPARGGAPELAFRDQVFIGAPAFDDTHAYVHVADGSIRRHLLSDGTADIFVTPEAIAAALGVPLPPLNERITAAYHARSEPELAKTVWVDATSVYWLDPSRFVVLRAAKGDGKPEIFARLPDRTWDLALDSDFLYLTHEVDEPPGALPEYTALRRISKAHPALGELLAKPKYVSFTLADSGVVWEAEDRLFGISPVAGFRDLGGLILLPERETARYPTKRLTGSGNDLFFVQTGDYDFEGAAVVRRTLDGRYTVLGSGYKEPIALTPSADTLYFVEAGSRAAAVSHRRRSWCCTIWAAAR